MRESFDMVGLVDLVIAITVLELCALALYRRSTGRGVALRDFAVNMVSGLCLMLALRCMAAGTEPFWVAGCLLAAGVAHFTDIAMRWRRSQRAFPAVSKTGAIA